MIQTDLSKKKKIQKTNSVSKQLLFINEQYLIRLLPGACKKKELHRNGSSSLEQSGTREIIKGQPLKSGKYGLAMQITLREVVAL